MVNGNNGNGDRPVSMSSSDKKPKLRKKRSPGFKFAVVFLSVIVVFLLLATVAILGYSYVMRDRTIDSDDEKERRSAAKVLNMDLYSSSNNLLEVFSSIPQRTNFVIMGLDDDGQSNRTDAIMVCSFNSATCELSFISIPRDTFVTMSQTQLDVLAEYKRTRVPSTMKVNAVYTYSGKTLGPTILCNVIEEILGISIQYYALVDLEGFKFIVNEIGGVWFDVPQRMYYQDPEEDLYIDLQPGYQLLMGDNAMGLVRYRKSSNTSISKSYPAADLKRVEVQQEFVSAAITQMLNKDTLMQNAGSFVELLMNYVDTNLPLTDALKYINYVKDLKTENIHSYTIPGAASASGEYYYIDTAKTYDLVQEIFFGNTASEE